MEICTSSGCTTYTASCVGKTDICDEMKENQLAQQFE